MLILILFFLISCSSLNHQYKFELENEIDSGWKNLSDAGRRNIYKNDKLDLFLDIYITDSWFFIGPVYLPIFPIESISPFVSCDRIRFTVFINKEIGKFKNFLNVKFGNNEVVFTNIEYGKGIDYDYYYIYDSCYDLSYVKDIKIKFSDIKNSEDLIEIPPLIFENKYRIVYEEFFAH